MEPGIASGGLVLHAVICLLSLVLLCVVFVGAPRAGGWKT